VKTEKRSTRQGRGPRFPYIRGSGAWFVCCSVSVHCTSAWSSAHSSTEESHTAATTVF